MTKKLPKIRKFIRIRKKLFNATRINKLKQNLMSKRPTSNQKTDNKSNKSGTSLDIHTITSEIYKVKNEREGKNFESNIRELLSFKYGWKKSKIDRHFFYRDIMIENNTYNIRTEVEEKFKIGNHDISFLLDMNKTLHIKTNKETLQIENKDKHEIFLKSEEKEPLRVKIDKLCEFESDGIYSVENLNISIFNSYEFYTVFKTVKENDVNNFKTISIEAKLNGNKFYEMLMQMQGHDEIMKKIIKEDVLYIGFLSSKKIPRKQLVKASTNIKINCIIFAINKSNFGGKDLLEFYDWPQIKLIKNLETKVIDSENNFESKINEMESRINQSLETKISQALETKINEMETRINQSLETKINEMETRINQSLETKINEMESRINQALETKMKDIKSNIKNKLKNDRKKKKKAEAKLNDKLDALLRIVLSNENKKNEGKEKVFLNKKRKK